MSGPYRDFHEDRLTPNDRVFMTIARSKITTNTLTFGLGAFVPIWIWRRIRAPRKGRWLISTFFGLCAAVPTAMYNIRNEYRRAIVELHDDSYLRRFLFDAAVLANPDLNAQQLYSQVAIEEHEKKQKQYMLEQQRMQHLHNQMTDRDYQEMQQQQQQQQRGNQRDFDNRMNDYMGKRSV